jgi:hypothetical protein
VPLALRALLRLRVDGNTEVHLAAHNLVVSQDHRNTKKEKEKKKRLKQPSHTVPVVSLWPVWARTRQAQSSWRRNNTKSISEFGDKKRMRNKKASTKLTLNTEKEKANFAIHYSGLRYVPCSVRLDWARRHTAYWVCWWCQIPSCSTPATVPLAQQRIDRNYNRIRILIHWPDQI